MESNQEKQQFWALVELMGHTRIAGLVTEVEFGGAKMIRVDVPEVEEGASRWGGASNRRIPAYTRIVGGLRGLCDHAHDGGGMPPTRSVDARGPDPSSRDESRHRRGVG